MDQQTVTLIVAGMGIGSTFCAIAVTHYLNRTWQREQWILDNKKQEYRELLSALSTAYLQLLRRNTFEAINSQAATLEIDTALRESFRVLHDRIFIAVELTDAGTSEQWKEAVQTFDRYHKKEVFDDAFRGITVGLLLRATLDHVPLTPWERFLRRLRHPFKHFPRGT